MKAEGTLEKRDGMRQVNVGAFLWVFGYFIGIGPFVAVTSLQSSINIEKGIGVASLGVAYVISLFVSLFATPSFIRRYGCKYALIVGEFSHFVYIVANFYPAPYIIIGTGIITGIGEGMIWTAMPMLSQYFGIKQLSYGARNRRVYIEKYTGLFLGAIFSGEVLGCLVAYAILFGGKQTGDGASPPSETALFINTTAVNTIGNSTLITVHDIGTGLLYKERTSVPSEVDPYEFCGARDCQDPEVAKAHIDHYVPSDKTFLNVLLGMFCLMTLFGIAIHAKFLPSAKPEDFHSRTADKHNGKEKTKLACEPQEETTQSFKSTLAATFRFAASMQPILMVPLLVHCGFFYAYYMSELGRAFTSCILGYDKVSLFTAELAFCCAISSFVSGRVITRFGRMKIVPVLLLIDLCNYAFCLLWRPQEDTVNMIHFIFLFAGITDPGWKACTLSAFADYFPRNQEIALTIWNTYFTIGIAICFCWSTLLCVSTKIYVQATLLVIGTITFGFAERNFRREKRKEYLQSAALSDTESWSKCQQGDSEETRALQESSPEDSGSQIGKVKQFSGNDDS